MIRIVWLTNKLLYVRKMVSLNRIFKFVAHMKVYFSSAGLYINVVNFVLILATFKATYNIDVSVFVIIPVGLVGMVFIGFVDYNMILKHQQQHINKQNDTLSNLKE